MIFGLYVSVHKRLLLFALCRLYELIDCSGIAFPDALYSVYIKPLTVTHDANAVFIGSDLILLVQI